MSKKYEYLKPYLLVAPSLLVILCFVVYPILNSFIRSFRDSTTGLFTLDNYTILFTDPVILNNIVFTIIIATLTAFITILISYPFAIFVRFSRNNIAKKMYNMILIPQFIPGIVCVYAIIQFISDTGVLNRISKIFGLNLQLALMYTGKGITYTNVWFNIPFSTMIIASALSSIKPANIESAKDVGANKLMIFKSIILPLSYKDVLVSATLIFMSNISSFTTPYLVGSTNPKMLGIVLYDQFSTYRNYEIASSLSVVMFLICAFSAMIYIRTNMKEAKWEKKNG